MIRVSKSNKGFSLVELAVFMALTGLMVASAFQIYKVYAQQSAVNTTLERRTTVEVALGRFFALNQRLPCPADPALPATDPMAGVEQCSGIPTDACIGGTALCSVTAANQLPAVPGMERVLIGSLPYVTMGLSQRDGYDGYGSQFHFKISELLANPSLLAPPNDKFDIQNSVLNRLSYNVGTGTYGPVQNGQLGGALRWPYAMISPGPDRRGGYNAQGFQAVPCAGLGWDIHNCDPTSPSVADTNYRSMVPGAEYNDDVAYTNSWVTQDDKWTFALATVGTLAIDAKADRVGLGTMDPNDRLTVKGNITALNLAADGSFCDENGINCFPATFIGGPPSGIECAATGISNANLNCVSMIANGTLQEGTCPAGEYLRGFCGSDGSIICAEPGQPDPPCPPGEGEEEEEEEVECDDGNTAMGDGCYDFMDECAYETRFVGCPAGYTGNKGEARSYACTTETWSPWIEFADNCVEGEGYSCTGKMCKLLHLEEGFP